MGEISLRGGRSILRRVGGTIVISRLRSAYMSLKNNLPYLFTYQDYPALQIPKYNKLIGRQFRSIKGVGCDSQRAKQEPEEENDQ